MTQKTPFSPTPRECAWCGAELERAFANRHGELFCSADHRTASNRARARLLNRAAPVPPPATAPCGRVFGSWAAHLKLCSECAAQANADLFDFCASLSSVPDGDYARRWAEDIAARSPNRCFCAECSGENRRLRESYRKEKS